MKNRPDVRPKHRSLVMTVLLIAFTAGGIGSAAMAASDSNQPSSEVAASSEMDETLQLPEDGQAPYRIIGQSPPPNPPQRFVYYHLDHLGSPRLILDENGATVSQHHYLPFGEELPAPASPDPTMNRRAFTGHERDAESGLDYMLARYYASSLGRFMAVDPAAESVIPGNPQTWNRYAYVLNNPLRLIDVTGLLAVDPQTAKQYPKAAKFIESMKPRSATEYGAFKEYGQADKAAVDAAFVSGSGPVVRGSSTIAGNGEYQVDTDPNALLINDAVLKAFESGEAGSKTLLESTTKHETTHYFDMKDGAEYSGGEAGILFEVDVYGQDIGNLQDGASYEQRPASSVDRKVQDMKKRAAQGPKPKPKEKKN